MAGQSIPYSTLRPWAVNTLTQGVSGNIIPAPIPESDAIITNGLVIHLDANNASSYSGSGTTWTDLEGNYNGTLVNGAGYTAAPGRIDFDGVDDYVNLGNITQLNAVTTFTIQMWLKPADIEPNRWTGRRVNGNNRISFGFRLPTAGNVSANVCVGANQRGYTAQALDITAWHFVTMVYDGAGATNADRLKIYYGSTAKTVSFSGTVPTATYNFGATEPYRIGDDGANNYFYYGAVSQFILYSRALNTDEITANYDDTKAAFGL